MSYINYITGKSIEAFDKSKCLYMSTLDYDMLRISANVFKQIENGITRGYLYQIV